MTTETPVSPRVRAFVLAVDRVTILISRHWLLLANLFLFWFVALPMLAPVLMEYGYTGVAGIIYSAYRLTCHGLAFRSFFLFGPQPVYSLDELNGLVSAGAQNVFYWSDFLGNPQLGYKMAWCERDVAMYGSVLIAGMVYGLLRPRLRPLNWRWYMLMLAPMAIDGTWQLFTSPLYWVTFLPVHESDWLLRTITGVLFGIGSVWIFYPHLQAAMRDIETQATSQFQRAMARERAR